MKKTVKQVLCTVLSALLLVFSLPAGAVQAWENPFEDVADTDWYYQHVFWASESGVMNGTSDTAFDPDAPMTRAMFVTTLFNWEQVEDLNYRGSRFQDVDAEAWYAAPIEWAASYGIVSGTGQGEFTFTTPTLDTFSPAAPLTRQDAVVILHHYTSQYITTVQPFPWEDVEKFPDSGEASDYAKEALAWAVGLGILNGSDGKLLPQGTLTRAQAAALLHNFLGRLTQAPQVPSAYVEARPDAWYLLGDQTYHYRIPEIVLEGVDTTEVNQAIQELYGDAYEQAIDTLDQGYTPATCEIGYYWNVYGDILSLVTYEEGNSNFYRYTVWNLDRTTGELLDNAALLQRSGHTLEEYDLAAKETLNNAFIQLMEGRGYTTPEMLGQMSVFRMQTLYPANRGLEDWETPAGDPFYSEAKSMKGTQLFVDNSGQLWMVGLIWHDAGSGRRYVPLPLGLTWK